MFIINGIKLHIYKSLSVYFTWVQNSYGVLRLYSVYTKIIRNLHSQADRQTVFRLYPWKSYGVYRFLSLVSYAVYTLKLNRKRYSACCRFCLWAIKCINAILCIFNRHFVWSIWNKEKRNKKSYFWWIYTSFKFGSIKKSI